MKHIILALIALFTLIAWTVEPAAIVPAALLSLAGVGFKARQLHRARKSTMWRGVPVRFTQR